MKTGIGRSATAGHGSRMPHGPRLVAPGTFHHVMACGIFTPWIVTPGAATAPSWSGCRTRGRRWRREVLGAVGEKGTRARQPAMWG